MQQEEYKISWKQLQKGTFLEKKFMRNGGSFKYIIYTFSIFAKICHFLVLGFGSVNLLPWPTNTFLNYNI